MYGMNLDNNSMSKFSHDGTLLAATVGSFSQNPEACLIVDANTMFTSQVRGTGGLLKLDLAGNQLAKYGSMRTDWIDLAADHCSMYYSDEGPAIHRYDVCTNKPLTDFVANLGVHIYALRILPNQTVLAATGAGVQLFDASGKKAQPVSEDRVPRRPVRAQPRPRRRQLLDGCARRPHDL